MDKEDRIIDLKLKKIELKLEKKKDLFKTIISFIIGIVSFLYTVNYIETLNSYFTTGISTIIEGLFKLPEPINIITILLLPFLMAYTTYRFSTNFMDSVLKGKEKMYKNAIEEVDFLLEDLEPKKKNSSN